MAVFFQANSWRKQESQHLGSSLAELPDYVYPAPVFVKNTFIDIQLERPVSLDEFIKQREFKSCPPQAFDSPDAAGPKDVQTPLSNCHRAETSSAALLALAANNAACVASHAVSSFRSWWNPVDSFTPPMESWGPPHQHAGHGTSSDFEGQCGFPVICLANALEKPALGSPELPTVGSAGHSLGTCKPCAFLHKRGCQNGLQCDFCHLCDEGEKKRRQKEKISRLKEMRGGA